MFSATVLFALFVGALSQDPEACDKLDCSSLRCCLMDSIQKTTEALMPLVKDCYDFPPDSCERAECVGKKLGFATADGNIDKAKATAAVEKDFGEQKDIVAEIKENCIDGDLMDYGTPDTCKLVKYERCIRIHLLGHCPKWDTTGTCAGIKEAAEECYKLY